MNSELTYKTTTTSPAASWQLGSTIGQALRGGEVIELTSDLGGGKTTIVKGLAHGLGYDGVVTSPTFTISRVYRLAHKLELHHFDFYRLDASDIVVRELLEVLGDPHVIVAIEWAANAGKVLPANRLQIAVTAAADSDRQISVEAKGTGYGAIIRKLQNVLSH